MKNLYLNKNLTACLTGHRPKNLPWRYNEDTENCAKFKEDLNHILINAINYGISNFLTGMAEGFDMIGTELLFKLKQSYNNIKIIAVRPCNNQEKFWSLQQQVKYKKLLKNCDKVITLSKIYTNTCMDKRNKFMVNNSSMVIACYKGCPGGTLNTLKYAKENNCKIKIINPDNYK